MRNEEDLKKFIEEVQRLTPEQRQTLKRLMESCLETQKEKVILC